MSKVKREKKKESKKDSALLIRINSDMRDRFIALCEDLDTSAAREIRGFIKAFLLEHSADAEPDDKSAR